jgi:hypothetical protein
MTTSGPDRDERLDRALALWASAARLPAARGTEMLTSLISTPAPEMPERRSPSALALSRTWWKEHSAGLAATFVSSTRPLADVA